MKKLKVVLWCILLCLLLPFFLFLIFFLILSLAAQREYKAPLQQPQEEIVQIELLDTHTHERISLYTLEETEISDFLLQLDSLVFLRYVNDPQTHDGILAIKITYQNGFYDILGTASNRYYTPEGNDVTYDAFYYLRNEETYIDLFSQYVASSLLPTEMIRN